MGTGSFCASFLLSIFILHSCLNHHIAGGNLMIETNREALEIITGGDGGSYSPSPPPPEPLSLPPPSPPPVSERIAMVIPVIQRFKTKITHDPHGITNTWVGSDVCNKFKGFVCDSEPKKNMIALAGVDFNGYDLGGPDLSLAGFLDELPDIAVFHANSNHFTGSIPQKILDLPYLYELDLSNNNYFGEFPTEIISSTQLTFLDLRFNSFVGVVPSQVFMLDLDVLFLNNNNYKQSLPENLGSTPALYITLANNRFFGPIPPSIGQASRTLIEIVFLNNQLSGCLPYEIGFLNKAKLFDVEFNQLTGPIPHSFACLENMELLNLAQNQFYGPVPELVCKLPILANLSLSYNYFTQVGPECRKLIKKNVLDVSMNCIFGLKSQRSAADCAAFFSQPNYCPDLRSLHYVPCNGYDGGNSQETSDRQSMTAATPPRSYDALIHRRL